MCNFQNSFLIVLLISLVCFSYTYCGKNDEIEECMFVMKSTFGLFERPIEYVKFAIKYLKLYGKNKYNFDKHTIAYYRTFHTHVNTDRIMLPRDFCGLNTDCLNQIRMFEDVTRGDKLIMSGFSEEELNIINNTRGFEGVMEESPSTSSGPSELGTSVDQSVVEGVLHVLNSFDVAVKSSSERLPNLSGEEFPVLNSSSDRLPSLPGLPGEVFPVLNSTSVDQSVVGTSVDPSEEEGVIHVLNSFDGAVETSTIRSSLKHLSNLKRNILYNALYYHAIVEPPLIVPTDETTKYFHTPGSHGQIYLEHISDSINVSGLKHPQEFCQQLYPNQFYNLSQIM